MARIKRDTKRPIESYEHRDKQCVNNPPVGLVTPETDQGRGAEEENLQLSMILRGFLVILGGDLKMG